MVRADLFARDDALPFVVLRPTASSICRCIMAGIGSPATSSAATVAGTACVTGATRAPNIEKLARFVMRLPFVLSWFREG
jgi:hypothetical protein